MTESAIPDARRARFIRREKLIRLFDIPLRLSDIQFEIPKMY